MIYRITYQGEGKQRKKLASPVKNRAELMALRDSKRNLEMLEKARKGDDEAKGKLLQLAYNIGHVEGLIAGCKSIGSFFFHDVDCYDSEQSEAIRDMILAKKDEIGLVMLERSVGGGWHLVCRRVPKTSILENQVRVAMALHLEMDTNTKDLQRVCYSTSGSEDDLVYLDDEVFEEPMSAEECEEEYKLLKEREKKNLEDVPKGAKKANKHYRPWEEEGSGVKQGDTLGTGTLCSASCAQMSQIPAVAPTRSLSPCVTQMSKPQGATETPDGAPSVTEADERTRFVFRECMKEEVVEPEDFVIEGRRHNSVKNVLGLCNQLLSKAETQGVLKEMMPNNWQDENIQQLVEAFYTDYYNPSQRLSLAQKRIFKESKALTQGAGTLCSAGYAQMSKIPADAPTRSLSPCVPSPCASDDVSTLAPKMPERLPKVIQLLTSKVDDRYKPAVANAVFPPLATHLCNVRFNYTDNVEHEATLMNCLMAGTGEGKGCIDAPIDHIMADIKRRDKENEDREDEWKKEWNRKGANKDKMVRPEGLVIQMIDPDMTKPALVTRMNESEDHFVYVKLNELDLFEQLKGQTGKQHFQLMCLAFDPNSEYGQTRIGTQSVTARPKCRFNWNACTTIQKGRKFFAKVLTDGPISRINFCTIPDSEIGCDQPVYGKYDAEFDEQLKPYIDNLCNARGLIDCPQAFRLAKKLLQECADFARLSQNRVYWNLSHRACVIAWLKACVIYVANGQKWEKSIEEFIRWSLNYDLYCKMAFFGDDIARANDGSERIGQRGPRNLLELLPDEFTVEDAIRIRQQEGLSASRKDAMHMIRTWKSRYYCAQSTEHSFVKSEKYCSKNKK